MRARDCTLIAVAIVVILLAGEERTYALIEKMCRTHPIDRDRIYLIGYHARRHILNRDHAAGILRYNGYDHRHGEHA